MTITTAQSVTGGQWNLGNFAGEINALRNLAPQQKVAPFGSTAIINGVNTSYANLVNTVGVAYTTAGFDPSIIFQLSTKLRTTGQIWPCGFS
jgi:hypothetical protein